MFEAPIIKPSSDKQEPVDAQWYGRLQKIGAFKAFEYLTSQKEFDIDSELPTSGPLAKQKSAFLKGEIDAPEFDYSKLEKFDFAAKEKNLIELKRTIASDEASEVIRQAYVWKINEKIAELRMLLAAKNGEDRKFLRYSKYLYGEPDKSIFDYTLFELSKKTNAGLQSDNPIIRNIAQRLRQELLDNHPLDHSESAAFDAASLQIRFAPAEANVHIFPDELAIKKVREQNSIKFTADEIISVFESAIKKYGLPEWKVVKSETHTTINVDQEKKILNVPEKRTASKDAVLGLIEHEIGTHILRRERGEKSRLQLLGIGLDRYGDDEGVATYKEQQVRGAEDFSGFIGYLSISLALGADGKKRNFREVFKILKDYYILIGKQSAEADNAAWNNCIRTFRGTSGKTPGACFTKDLLYRTGNIAVWHLAKENSAEMRRLMVGKYDPSNTRHLWVLEQLNITDEDLSRLEN
jgi:hypothetical protein